MAHHFLPFRDLGETIRSLNPVTSPLLRRPGKLGAKIQGRRGRLPGKMKSGGPIAPFLQELFERCADLDSLARKENSHPPAHKAVRLQLVDRAVRGEVHRIIHVSVSASGHPASQHHSIARPRSNRENRRNRLETAYPDRIEALIVDS